MKDKILSRLINEKTYLSGEKISQDLNISRTTVWNYINQLRQDGYQIESVTNKGYKITSRPDLLSYSEIKGQLRTKFIGRDFIHLDQVDSTNLYARARAQDSQEGLVVVAEAQEMGKGRMGRNWISPSQKGIWMTILLKPKIDPVEAGKISLIASAAVSLAMEKLQINGQIKWPNDLLINRKKVGGILTEMSCELNQVDYILVGIGINVNLDQDDLTKDLSSKASSLKIETGQRISRQVLMAEILNEFEELYLEFSQENRLDRSIKINRDKLVFLGEDVRLISRQGQELVRAVDLNSQGHLLVEDESGSLREIGSGEISIRGLEGYI